jgi:hypothetical protein
MSEKTIRVGFDRFLALKWANYSLELFLSSDDETENYSLLKTYLDKEISGKDSSRKTANQLKRLWLNNQDEHQELRILALDILKRQHFTDQSIFHLGMAINIFPIFKETCKKIGELNGIQESFSRQVVIDRVSQIFINPTSIPRIVSRVIQTLEDWNYLDITHSEIKVRAMPVEDKETSCWFIRAIMSSYGKSEFPLTDIDLLYEKLGLSIPDIRKAIKLSNTLIIRRNPVGIETIKIT